MLVKIKCGRFLENELKKMGFEIYIYIYIYIYIHHNNSTMAPSCTIFINFQKPTLKLPNSC
jgi:hypothetical protein